MMTTQCNEREDKQSEEIWKKSSLGASPKIALIQRVMDYHEGRHNCEHVITKKLASTLYKQRSEVHVVLTRIRLNGISKL